MSDWTSYDGLLESGGNSNRQVALMAAVTYLQGRSGHSGQAVRIAGDFLKFLEETDS